MRKILEFFKKQWWFITHTEFRSDLSHEEFKKLWNKNLEEMKMD